MFKARCEYQGQYGDATSLFYVR